MFLAIVAYTTIVVMDKRLIGQPRLFPFQSEVFDMTQDVFFNELLEEGKRGELAVKKLLEDRGWLVYNVANEKEYQERDIDLVIEGEDTIKTIEVKTDNYINRTGNICFELISNISTGRKGWYHTCDADLLIVYATTRFIIIDMKQLKERGLPNGIISYTRCWENGKYYKESQIKLVKLTALQEMGIVQIINAASPLYV